MPHKDYTPKQKKLAARYGDRQKITRGDVITADEMKKKGEKKWKIGGAGV